MVSSTPRSQTLRILAISLLGAWALFSLGAWTILSIAPRTYLSERVPRLNLSLELGGLLMLYVAPLAIVLGLVYMYFFGGILSTRAMRLYLYAMRGKHIVTPNNPTTPISKNGFRVEIKRQGTYFGFILAAVVSFAMYLAKTRTLPVVATFTRTSDIATIISQEFVTLTMTASLMLPILALALPYYCSDLRLRSIDTGKFHSTVISLVISASGGFSILYSILQRPEFYGVLFYSLILLGVSWCFALGCNLAADHANKSIQRIIAEQKPKLGSRLLLSTILLKDLAGKLVEA